MGQRNFIDFVNELYINTLRDLPGHRCNPLMNYNYDNTFYAKIAEQNFEDLNCSVPFHPVITSSFSGNEIKICNKSDLGKKAIGNWAASFYSSHETPLDKPCAEMEIFLGFPLVNNDQAKHEAYIKIYIKSHVKVKSVILYYDITSLIADVGGYVGMLLGVSVVDFTIMFNSALTKAIILKYRQKC